LIHKSEYVTNRLVEMLKPVRYCSGIAPGGLTKPPGDSLSVRESALSRRLAARCAPPGGDEKQWGLGGRWRLARGEYRQAVWNSFAWRRVGRARRKRCCSLLGVLFLTDNDALLGSGDAVP